MVEDILIVMFGKVVFMIVKIGFDLHEVEGAFIHLLDRGEDSFILEVVQHTLVSVLLDGVLVIALYGQSVDVKEFKV